MRVWLCGYVASGIVGKLNGCGCGCGGHGAHVLNLADFPYLCRPTQADSIYALYLLPMSRSWLPALWHQAFDVVCRNVIGSYFSRLPDRNGVGCRVCFPTTIIDECPMKVINSFYVSGTQWRYGPVKRKHLTKEHKLPAIPVLVAGQ